MTLFHYDHCPYCVKARLILGLKNIPHEEKVLLNDDEETPISMIGQKMLPILQMDDGTYMPESMDIIHYVDGLNGYENREVKPSRNGAFSRWMKECRQYHYALAMPRWPEMGLEEFATESAKQYFIKKKENSVGPFSECLARSKELIAKANQHLLNLEEMCVGEPYFWGEELSEDDFHVFAALRVMSSTKGIVFPPKLKKLMSFLSEKGKVPLHWDKALGEEF